MYSKMLLRVATAHIHMSFWKGSVFHDGIVRMMSEGEEMEG